MRIKYISKNQGFFILKLFALYLIVLLFRGYLYASNDLVDVMSYAKFLQNNNLYPGDFYIQQIAKTLPNERIVFASFLALLGSTISWSSFFLHLITSLFLFAGIYNISKKYIHSELFRWMVPLILFIPLYGKGVGSCELYYNMFIASLAAKAIGIWAILFYLNEKNNRPYFLLIAATLIHPTVGAQIFLIFLASDILKLLFTKYRMSLPGILIYFATAGIYLFLLQFRVYENIDLSTSQLFEIFEFRLAHHFFPSYFPSGDFLIGIILALISIIYFTLFRSYRPTAFILITISGMLIYTLSINFYPVEIILSSQWFKSYIWVELLGIIALFAFTEKYILKALPLGFLNRATSYLLLLSGAMAVALIFIDNPISSGKRYDLPFNRELSMEADIGMKAKKLTSQDALFVVPMHFTEFKYFSERSLYIDYKSVVHRKDALPEWYRRIFQIYKIDIVTRRGRIDLYQQGRKNYKQLNEDDIEKLIKEGVEYIVTFKAVQLDLQMVDSNDEYIIYAL